MTPPSVPDPTRPSQPRDSIPRPRRFRHLGTSGLDLLITTALPNLRGWWWHGIAMIENSSVPASGLHSPQLDWSVQRGRKARSTESWSSWSKLAQVVKPSCRPEKEKGKPNFLRSEEVENDDRVQASLRYLFGGARDFVSSGRTLIGSSFFCVHIIFSEQFTYYFFFCLSFWWKFWPCRISPPVLNKLCRAIHRPPNAYPLLPNQFHHLFAMEVNISRGQRCSLMFGCWERNEYISIISWKVRITLWSKQRDG